MVLEIVEMAVKETVEKKKKMLLAYMYTCTYTKNTRDQC